MNSAKVELDHKVLDIELLLISVVQGVALAALATSSIPVFEHFKFEYYLYVAAAILIILTFWSQAIVHTLSFISWPIDLYHNFFYFLVAFVEVLAFAELTNPFMWFVFNSIFYIVAGILYIVDYFLIKDHENDFKEKSDRKKLYLHVISRHLFELKVFIPIGFAVSMLSAAAIYFYPTIFITGKYHVLLILFQVIFAACALGDSVKNFKRRSRLITISEGM